MMRSKQINFFLSPADMPEVNSFLLENNCQVLRSESKNPSIDNTEYNILKNSENIFQVYLCKGVTKENIFYEYLESKNHYYIDILKSYCIEFSLGGIYPYSNKEFHSSRFYYITGYYEKGQLVRKDEQFISWADDLFSNFKKKLLKKVSKYQGDYLSEKFIDWITENDAQKTLDGTKFIIK